VRATAATREGRAQDVAGGRAGRRDDRASTRLQNRLLAPGTQLVETPDASTPEAGDDQSIGPVAEPLPTAALNEEEEEVLGRARA
jgi:hypothetical protein